VGEISNTWSRPLDSIRNLRVSEPVLEPRGDRRKAKRKPGSKRQSIPDPRSGYLH
jgi:hypothetical protein